MATNEANRKDDDPSIAMDKDDVSRLALLLTDVLGDMKIKDRNKKAWIPANVARAIADPRAGGLLWLASKLLSEMQSLDKGSPNDKKTATANKKKVNLNSWEDLHRHHERFCPPWVNAKDMIENLGMSRLEVLSFLASTLQNRMLSKPTTENKSQTSATNNTHTHANAKVKEAASESTASSPILPALPAHLTPKQRKIVLLCYQGMQADYDKRRTGMQQRLDILATDFEADNPDDPELAKVRTKIQGLSLSSSLSPPTMALSNDDLRKHFTAPHSKSSPHDPSSKAAVPAPSPLDALLIVDRGGRTDEVESRVAVMPAWSSSRS